MRNRDIFGDVCCHLWIVELPQLLGDEQVDAKTLRVTPEKINDGAHSCDRSTSGLRFRLLSQSPQLPVPDPSPPPPRRLGRTPKRSLWLDRMIECRPRRSPPR